MNEENPFIQQFTPDKPEDIPPRPPQAVADAAAKAVGFDSRQPTTRRRVKRMEGQTDQFNVRANVEDINKFVAWMEKNRYRSQREAFHELVKLIDRK